MAADMEADIRKRFFVALALSISIVLHSLMSAMVGIHLSLMASVYNLLAIPVAAGAFHHWLGWSLRPEFSALLMSVSSIIVAVNAVMLRRSEGSLLSAQA